MKYTPEITEQIVKQYQSGVSIADIAAEISERDANGIIVNPVPERSVIAKLSSLGVYKKKEYLTKRGEVPVKKEEYIERIAALLDVNSDILESLEKVNKSVLALLEVKLKQSEG